MNINRNGSFDEKCAWMRAKQAGLIRKGRKGKLMDVTYMLELTKEELRRLERLLRLIHDKRIGGGLEPEERAIWGKVERLMDGK